MHWNRPPYFDVAYYLLKSFAFFGQLFSQDIAKVLSTYRQKSLSKVYVEYLLEQGYILPSNQNSYMITDTGLEIVREKASFTTFLLSDSQFQAYYSLLYAEDRIRKGVSLPEKESLRISSLLSPEDYPSLSVEIEEHLLKIGRPNPLRGLIAAHQVNANKGLLHQMGIPENDKRTMPPSYGKTLRERGEILEQLGEYPDDFNKKALLTSYYLFTTKACWLFLFLCMAQRQESALKIGRFTRYLKKRKVATTTSIEKVIKVLKEKGLPIFVDKGEGTLSLYGDFSLLLPLNIKLERQFTGHIWDFINKKTKTVEIVDEESLFIPHPATTHFSSSIGLSCIHKKSKKTLLEIEEWSNVGPVFFPFQSFKDNLSSFPHQSVPYVWGRESYNEEKPHQVLEKSPVLYLLTVLLAWCSFQETQIRMERTEEKEYGVFYQNRGPFPLLKLIKKTLQQLGFTPLYSAPSVIHPCLQWLQRVGWVRFLPGTVGLEEDFQGRLGYSYEMKRYWNGPLPTRIKEAFKEVFHQWERI